jgi:hypothetical protein
VPVLTCPCLRKVLWVRKMLRGPTLSSERAWRGPRRGGPRASPGALRASDAFGPRRTPVPSDTWDAYRRAGGPYVSRRSRAQDGPPLGLCGWRGRRCGLRAEGCYLVDPASSHMLVSKIKPCMCKYEQIRTVKLRMAH